MKILCTGHQGFVGSHFMRVLDTPENEVIGIDLKDGNDCRTFFRNDTGTHFDLVIHLAAIVGGRLTISYDPLKVATDLSIDAEMFNWAVRAKPSRIVYYSSSAAYPIDLQNQVDAQGHPLPHFLTENDIDLAAVRNPDMTYGWSKLTGEILADLASKHYGLKVHVFRPFSGYGEDQDLDYPFPSFVQRAKNKENPFVIWSDGLQVRDWIHIDDIVEATLEAVEQNVDGPVNLGNGEPVSFNQLALMVTRQAGYQPEIKHLLDKPRGVGFRCSDNTKMLSFYKPKVSLEEGIRRALCVSA